MTIPEALPAAARHWLDRARPASRALVEEVRLRQNGELESKGRWLRFGAGATFHADPFSFEWRARLRVMPGMWVNAVDGHNESSGWGGAKMWGIRSMGERDGPEVHVMQLTRSIAELAWLPDLGESAAGLRWAEAGKSAFTITGRAGGRDVSVRFSVDVNGDIISACSKARPCDVPGGYETSSWRMDYADHGDLDGVRIPTSGVATYEHDDEPWEYLRIKVIGRERL